MPSRIPFVSLTVLSVATALLWTLCLPVVPSHAPDIQHVSTVFRPEWLILATLLVGPLKRAAAWRCWVGLLGLVIASALSLAITDEAVARVQAAGLELAGTESLWMAFACCQVLLFTIATGRGLRQRMFVRRWHRLSRKLAARGPLPSEPSTTAS